MAAIADSGFDAVLDQLLLQFDELGWVLHGGKRLNRNGPILNVLCRQFLIRLGQLLNSRFEALPLSVRVSAPPFMMVSAAWALLAALLQGRSLKTRGTGTTSIRFPLCSAVEHAGDKDRLCSDIAPVDISNLTLPDHRHRLETCQRSPRRSETAEAQSRPDQSLDAPVILLDDVVQVLALPQTGAAQVRRPSSSPLQLSDRRDFYQP